MEDDTLFPILFSNFVAFAGVGVSTSIINLLNKMEHLAGPFAEFMELLALQHRQGRVVVEVIRFEHLLFIPMLILPEHSSER